MNNRSMEARGTEDGNEPPASFLKFLAGGNEEGMEDASNLLSHLERRASMFESQLSEASLLACEQMLLDAEKEGVSEARKTYIPSREKSTQFAEEPTPAGRNEDGMKDDKNLLENIQDNSESGREDGNEDDPQLDEEKSDSERSATNGSDDERDHEEDEARLPSCEDMLEFVNGEAQEIADAKKILEQLMGGTRDSEKMIATAGLQAIIDELERYISNEGEDNSESGGEDGNEDDPQLDGEKSDEKPQPDSECSELPTDMNETTREISRDFGFVDGQTLLHAFLIATTAFAALTAASRLF